MWARLFRSKRAPADAQRVIHLPIDPRAVHRHRHPKSERDQQKARLAEIKIALRKGRFGSAAEECLLKCEAMDLGLRLGGI